MPLALPSEATIIGLGVTALDQSASGEVSARLLRCPLFSSCSLLGPVVSTGVPDQPGLTQIRDNLAIPHTVDNGTSTYAVFVFISGATDATRLIGLRVFYRL